MNKKGLTKSSGILKAAQALAKAFENPVSTLPMGLEVTNKS
jgi:hypothetical protein